MKKILKNTIALLAVTISVMSCSGDDSTSAITGTGNLTLEFDNAFKGNDLILNTQQNTTSEGEVLKISTVKYIVSNITLTSQDGTVFTYPKSQSYFIVDESTNASRFIKLMDVPAGNYAKVSFGIGVDQEQFNAGAAGQGDFLAQAQAADLMWSWSAGYKFLAFEGSFTASDVENPAPFMVHTGKTGTDYNYTTITVDLPAQALVRTDISPEIHIVADVSKVIDGQNKISLSANNTGGMGAMIMGGANLRLITENLSTMFSVAHVHND